MSEKLTKAQKAESKKKKKLTVEEDSTPSRSIASIKKELKEKNPRSVLKGNAAFPLRYAVAIIILSQFYFRSLARALTFLQSPSLQSQATGHPATVPPNR